ncbi:MAG: hypothetical protein HQM09_14460 [Candidatus Riflebacteria bacterium]|nr:hypothetical protein [Candidatus Riflebacteria bacterium]
MNEKTILVSCDITFKTANELLLQMTDLLSNAFEEGVMKPIGKGFDFMFSNRDVSVSAIFSRNYIMMYARIMRQTDDIREHIDACFYTVSILVHPGDTYPGKATGRLETDPNSEDDGCRPIWHPECVS